MKYELKLNGRTYEVEVELAEPMLMQEFQQAFPHLRRITLTAFWI